MGACGSSGIFFRNVNHMGRQLHPHERPDGMGDLFIAARKRIHIHHGEGSVRRQDVNRRKTFGAVAVYVLVIQCDIVLSGSVRRFDAQGCVAGTVSSGALRRSFAKPKRNGCAGLRRGISPDLAALKAHHHRRILSGKDRCVRCCKDILAAATAQHRRRQN